MRVAQIAPPWIPVPPVTYGGTELMVAGLILAMIQLPPPDIPDVSFNTGMLKRAIWTLLAVMGSFVPVAVVLGHFLPAFPLFRKLS